MTRRYFHDALEEAQYRVVREYPGGARALAPLVGMHAGTLSNKVNPSNETHHLATREAVAMQHAAKDFRILHAEAQLLHHTCIPLTSFEGVSDAELLDLYAGYHKELGETAEAIRDALADGAVTRRELERVRKELFEDTAAAFEFLARLEDLVDE
ncbi:MAG: phage regulatory CII family protein [Thiohalorhabdus sp.]|uniref:phage regulatory CII family protein n=1 Tax=Thiohalorhabdus sp. TaxID=3094134 RepID=UPI0039818670